MSATRLYGDITLAGREESFPQRWDRHARLEVELAVMIPNESPLAARIAPGSGIVASPMPTGDQAMAHFEGNLHGAVNMGRWVERVHQAAGRHVVAYPTSAKLAAPAGTLIRIGSYSVANATVTVEDDKWEQLLFWVRMAPNPAETTLEALRAPHPHLVRHQWLP